MCCRTLSAQITSEPTPYLRTRRDALATLECLRQAAGAGSFPVSKLETRWLGRLSAQADTLPEDEGEFIAQVLPTVDQNKVRLSEYGF